MADWSKDNRACKALWTCLYRMKQVTTNFDDSGSLQINSLLFYSSIDSAELRKQEAISIADELDTVFRNGLGADYENNLDRANAMQQMVEILTDGNKSLPDLASTVDACYKFWGE